MRIPILLSTLVLLAACSDDAPPPPQASSEVPPPAVAQAQPAPAEKADLAAAEAAEPKEQGTDPCDLSGYDMNKMTVDMHEELVKACYESKP